MTKELAAKDIKNLTAEHLYAPAAEASYLVVACRRVDYSASRLARAVEDADAHVLNLNVTACAADGYDDHAIVALRVSRREAAAVARSLERYGYDVLDFESQGGDMTDADTLAARLRAAELLKYLEM